jgi:hypothetical protein
MKRILALICLTGALCACRQTQAEEQESVDIQGLQEAIAFPANPAEGASFTIESNVAWSIRKDGLDWLTIDPMRGNPGDGPQTVRITAAENRDDAARSGSFTVKAGTVTKTVSLTQAGATVIPSFSTAGLTDNTLTFKAEETKGKSFTVASNKDWTATTANLDWAEVTPCEGRKDRSATITVIPKSTNDGAAREGTVSFAFGGSAPVTVKVVQNGFVPEISATPASLLVAADGSADVTSITVKSNASWTATAGASWITLDKTAGESGETVVKCTFQVNDKYEDRSATVVFENRGAKAEVTVRQVAKPTETLTVSPTSLAFAEGGGDAAVTIESNASWSVAASDRWLTVTPGSGTGNATITVTAAANPGDERTATLTISISATLKQTITITQAAGASAASFIDLSTPLVWVCDNQGFNMQRSPAYPSAGQTGARTDGGPTGSGIIFPDRPDDLAYIQYEKGENELGDSYKALFIFAKEGHIAWKPIWTNDAMVLHIPVKSIRAGQTLYFDYGIRGTTTCPRYWISEVNIGGTWEPFDTGLSEEVTSGDAAFGPANSKATTANTAFSYEGKYVVKADVSHQEILLRIRCVCGNIGTGGKTYGGVQSAATLRLTEGDINGIPFRGPTVYVK